MKQARQLAAFCETWDVTANKCKITCESIFADLCQICGSDLCLWSRRHARGGQTRTLLFLDYINQLQFNVFPFRSSGASLQLENQASTSQGAYELLDTLALVFGLTSVSMQARTLILQYVERRVLPCLRNPSSVVSFVAACICSRSELHISNHLRFPICRLTSQLFLALVMTLWKSRRTFSSCGCSDSFRSLCLRCLVPRCSASCSWAMAMTLWPFWIALRTSGGLAITSTNRSLDLKLGSTRDSTTIYTVLFL